MYMALERIDDLWSWSEDIMLGLDPYSKLWPFFLLFPFHLFRKLDIYKNNLHMPTTQGEPTRCEFSWRAELTVKRKKLQVLRKPLGSERSPPRYQHSGDLLLLFILLVFLRFGVCYVSYHRIVVNECNYTVSNHCSLIIVPEYCTASSSL